MIRILGPMLAMLTMVGCTFALERSHIASGETRLCSSSRDLGRVAVLPETAWRVDQKDVIEREAMARAALDRVFATGGCGEDVEVRAFAPWSAELEEDRLAALAAEGVDTAVFIRIEELGPTLAVTFSLPFLWVGTSEAQVRLRAIHLPTRRVLLDVGITRSVGGPFQVRPASWAGPELEAMLVALLRSDG